ncbi:hypothetical protein E2562_007052 [Oryza meyeriana var. granulata]|uniref:Uncharacterized protein n=1 Tax=Oryza meyeriana var. granulata TaxID=110450 RepID=A0A6G1F4U5_9ORYZ|nr:hypothetical protein E2562_007052 [Oryza meyeriana var. granulata]
MDAHPFCFVHCGGPTITLQQQTPPYYVNFSGCDTSDSRGKKLLLFLSPKIFTVTVSKFNLLLR